MNIIAENPTPVNKELQFGRLIHSPVVAWAFDLSCSRVEPVPVAVGCRARFLKNYKSNFQLVPAAPGFYEVAYVADPQHRKLFDVPETEMSRTAGTFYLGTETPNDGIDWLKVARDCECQHTFFSTNEAGKPIDEFVMALHSGGAQ